MLTEHLFFTLIPLSLLRATNCPAGYPLFITVNCYTALRSWILLPSLRVFVLDMPLALWVMTTALLMVLMRFGGMWRFVAGLMWAILLLSTMVTQLCLTPRLLFPWARLSWDVTVSFLGRFVKIFDKVLARDAKVDSSRVWRTWSPVLELFLDPLQVNVLWDLLDLLCWGNVGETTVECLLVSICVRFTVWILEYCQMLLWLGSRWSC